MARKNNWDERYIMGDLPWDTDRYDFNLKEIITHRKIKPCKTLEAGCGTGSNALWLSRRGFRVTAIDISQAAIQQAIKKASSAGLRCKFYAKDFLKDKISGAPFGFLFDRGCFHSVKSKDRTQFAKNAYAYLKKGGFWLTLTGNADEPPRNPGPPRLSARDIVAVAEPYFEIICLYTSHLDSDLKEPPRAWVCLMQRRS